MWHRRVAEDDRQRRRRDQTRREILDAQSDDGAWKDTSVGDAYGTAMSLIILQMPKRYLPIFQK